MAVDVKVLVEPQFIPTAGATLFTSVGQTMIDKTTTRNDGTAPAIPTIRLVRAGGSPDAASITVTPNIRGQRTYEVTELDGHVLEDGDYIYASANTADVLSLRISGRVIS